ncbi:hypothetical protein PDJ82_25385 [Bacillus cereus group sp. TH43LC]|uniref:hypothetical protein n=1 Tax=Bacillus cereus group TaxID=86661 RepID=UPI000772310A|nr:MULTISPECIES: hypothetical protein [Bacillus cereus group]KXI66142.1 hypothetical protein ACS51_25645 [Bacillus cereus]MCC2436341.1 hypothetical protein [Bacillus paranthracis]MDA1504913.1 hypothetical protein [Bacillus cereus group sp. TH43LC]MDA1862688.1 hypothetical protein [Bacillus cereus group sp. BY128LC]MDK7437929.1 hypothetical protein [Bacillus paranthracis]
MVLVVFELKTGDKTTISIDGKGDEEIMESLTKQLKLPNATYIFLDNFIIERDQIITIKLLEQKGVNEHV